MSIETWLAFVAASAVLLLIPGPTILLVVSYALGQGRKVALPVAAGVALGDFTAMTLSMFGLGALLATSATLFTVLKWIGALYLIWLGIKLWRAGASPLVAPAEGNGHGRGRALKMLGHAWLVTALNPKSITFFVAFLPQFLDTSRPMLGQMLVFETTFLVLAAANAFGYALVAGKLRGTISNSSVVVAVNRIGGSLLIGAGLATLAWRNAK
ncbi:threonine/homoserine/homoserine lactone efflux protein [Ancylobacter sp. 3268]|uniref:LysE family translocator n=1 Tax=Ancylobacter sp. 3268 TaxID=2817752 RepID=UPI002860D532|nr:LysE family translocator [Ancylobacter sp. 3268]MDR6950987.1 threonine/homoserine/homoserine lactone efflux protein [Ancylobacter sp. 3268]